MSSLSSRPGSAAPDTYVSGLPLFPLAVLDRSSAMAVDMRFEHVYLVIDAGRSVLCVQDLMAAAARLGSSGILHIVVRGTDEGNPADELWRHCGAGAFDPQWLAVIDAATVVDLPRKCPLTTSAPLPLLL